MKLIPKTAVVAPKVTRGEKRGKRRENIKLSSFIYMFRFTLN